MISDGQLYDVKHKGENQLTPPDVSPDIQIPKEHRTRKFNLNIHQDDLLIIGLLIVLLSDKCEPDIPLVLALAYILIAK